MLEIAPASLVANGRTAAFLGGRSGYGPGNASFELRFEPVAGAIGTLSVPFNVVGVNVGGNVSPEASRLAPFAGKATEVVIDLPE